jgi:hypothetical protein
MVICGSGDGSLIRPEIRKETTKQNHKRVMRSGSWIQATGPNNGHQLRDYSKSSNRSEIATPHKTTTMQEKQKILDLLHIFLHRFRVASGREMPYTCHTHTIHMPYTYYTLEHGYNMAS